MTLLTHPCFCFKTEALINLKINFWPTSAWFRNTVAATLLENEKEIKKSKQRFLEFEKVVCVSTLASVLRRNGEMPDVEIRETEVGIRVTDSYICKLRIMF